MPEKADKSDRRLREREKEERRRKLNFKVQKISKEEVGGGGHLK